MTMRLMHSGKEYDIEEVGLLRLQRIKTPELAAGSVGYVLAGIKTVRDIAIGDTLTDASRPAGEPLPGYKEAKPVVFSSIYPMTTDEYPELSKALDKLVLKSNTPLSQELKIEACHFAKCRWAEIPIEYRYRSGKAKLGGWKVGAGNLLDLVRKRIVR